MLPDDVWIFGYGSIVWKPDFPFAERAPGWIEGWSRHLWQGSPDHRGVPASPGRVVTLVVRPGARCLGVAYRVRGAERESVLRGLDVRESGGFQRLRAQFHFAAERRSPVSAIIYVAPPDNPNFLGEAPFEVMLREVRAARGRSGSNLEYVLRLADSLRELGAEEEELLRIAERLREEG